MSSFITPVEAFCSYASEDEVWLNKLETHLSLLKRQGLLSLWYNRLISPGMDWTQAIDTHLERASVILLWVSADFFASDYCYGIEMKRALERQEAGAARVIPILVRSTDWTKTPFAHLQALPINAKPLDTWKNKDAALASVAAGIRRVIEELPSPATSFLRTALPAIWNIPYSRNPFFLGRGEMLVRLRNHLLAGQITALSHPQAISGLGGIGKTQLALEYAYQYQHDYQAVLWTQAESAEALVSSYLTIASLLLLPKREAKEQDITVRAVKNWLQTHSGWLLIVDNVDDLTVLNDFLPPASEGHILLTTRDSSVGGIATRIEVDVFDQTVGTLFLLRRAGLLSIDASLEHASSCDLASGQELVRELGGLPLALDQAGAYIEETQCSLSHYLQNYLTRRTDLLKRRGRLTHDHPEPIATTWSLSFEKVEKQNPASADLLRLCAFLHPDTIPEEIIIEGGAPLGPHLTPLIKDPLLLDDALAVLRSYLSGFPGQRITPFLERLPDSRKLERRIRWTSLIAPVPTGRPKSFARPSMPSPKPSGCGATG